MSQIYVQHFSGKFRNIKNIINVILILGYFCGSWLRWNRAEGINNQALYINLIDRKAYFFNIEIWPNEIYYLAGLLIIAALGLFIFTSIWGRLWCGYTCPQTVFVDIFNKIESFWQGDRNTRMKMDKNAKMNIDSGDKRKLKKIMTYFSWLSLSFLFAYGWVCYFYGAPQLTKDILNCSVSANATIWLLCLTFSTYTFAAILKDKVCVYFCPYGRFQSAMLDNDTNIVTYHDWRGELRGHDTKDSIEHGDCIDCGKCVFACPMGIDIRDGLQIGCIGCGLCIDACDSVMEKLKRPLGLISYDSINSTNAKIKGKQYYRNLFRMKTIIYLIIFAISLIILIYSIITKNNYFITIDKDRNPTFTIIPDGSIRNGYTINIANHSSRNYSGLKLKIIGLNDNALFAVQTNTSSTLSALEYGKEFVFNMNYEQELHLTVFIKLPHKYIENLIEEHAIKLEELPIIFVVHDPDGKEIMIKKSVFSINYN